jgi:hypothetical protein
MLECNNYDQYKLNLLMIYIFCYKEYMISEWSLILDLTKTKKAVRTLHFSTLMISLRYMHILIYSYIEWHCKAKKKIVIWCIFSTRKHYQKFCDHTKYITEK